MKSLSFVIFLIDDVIAREGDQNNHKINHEKHKKNHNPENVSDFVILYDMVKIW